MYCSENCRNDDGSSAHSLICGNTTLPKLIGGSNGPSKTQYPPVNDLKAACYELMMRLIGVIGLETIKTTAQENKPMKSLLGDKRTKGFVDGKFEAVTLESLLSLEDNFDKFIKEEKLKQSYVRLILNSPIFK
jgi:hypothetical protein